MSAREGPGTSGFLEFPAVPPVDGARRPPRMAGMQRSLLLITLLASSLAAQSTTDAFFGLDKIWDVHLVVDRASWTRLFPKGPRAATRLFGKFSYQRADVTIGNHVFREVGLRMKGNATFAATGGTLKRSLKLDFNRFRPKQRFLGMGKLNLQCNALDGTQIKEAVSYAIYRACGVTVGRTAFIRLFLTLEGELEKAYVGLYTAVEQVDRRFAKRTLGESLILKPDGETLVYHGPKWNDAYAHDYHPKSPVTPELAQPLIDSASLFDEPDNAKFARRLAKCMDVESFLTYTAATAILVNTDSPLTVPDNYYLLVPQKTRRVTWVPWDMNWSLGEYGRATGTPSADLDILMPTRKEVFRRVLGVPEFASRYRKIARKFIEGPASAEAMIAAIRTADATVKDARAREAKRKPLVTRAPRELGGRAMRHRMLRTRADDDVPGLVAFARARERSVKAQLAGKESGSSAWNLFGANDRSARGQPVRDLFAETGALSAKKAPFSKDALETAAGQGFARLDTDGSNRLDRAELTAAFRRRFEKSRRRRRDPSADQTLRALAHLDLDGAPGVSPDEWRSALARLRPYWDRDRNGQWSPEELGLVP